MNGMHCTLTLCLGPVKLGTVFYQQWPVSSLLKVSGQKGEGMQSLSWKINKLIER